MIQPSTLARMQARDERAMPDTCSILHVTPGTVAPGGDGTSTTGDVTTTTSGIPCRLTIGPAATEALIAMRLTDVADAVISVPLGTVVALKDQVVKGGDAYEVAGTDAGKSFATSLRIGLKRVQ